MAPVEAAVRLIRIGATMAIVDGLARHPIIMLGALNPQVPRFEDRVQEAIKVNRF